MTGLIVSPGEKLSNRRQSQEVAQASLHWLHFNAEEGHDWLRAISEVLLGIWIINVDLDAAQVFPDKLRNALALLIRGQTNAQFSVSGRAPRVEQGSFTKTCCDIDDSVDLSNSLLANFVKVPDELQVTLISDE